MNVLGLDPGLTRTGWGIVSYQNQKLIYISSGTIGSKSSDKIDKRLVNIDIKLSNIIKKYSIEMAAIEEVFVNINPKPSLLLGMARGVIIATCARNNLPISEYSPNKIKKSVTGSGHAKKEQIETMIKMLLPKASTKFHDESDALAIAITHNYIYSTNLKWQKTLDQKNDR